MKKYQVGDLNPNEWVVKVSDLKREIMKHFYCVDYHKIEGKDASCIDMIFNKLNKKREVTK